MRIWAVTHGYPRPGGIGAFFFAHNPLREVVRRGHSVTVFELIRATGPRLLSQVGWTLDGVEVLPVPYVPFIHCLSIGLDQAMKRAALRNAWRRRRRMHRPDVVFAQSLYPDGTVCSPLCKAWRFPLVTMMIGGDVNRYPIESDAIRVAVERLGLDGDLFIGVSEDLTREAAESLLPSNSRTAVLHTGVDMQAFRRVVPIRDPPRRLLYVGGFASEKGILDIVKATKRIVRFLPDVTLTIAGGGVARGAAEKEIRTNGLQASIRVLGQVPHVDMPALMNEHDILVHPSRREGLPNCVVEAVACERAVVVADVEGIREIAPASPSFVMVRPGFIHELTDAILAMQAAPVDSLRESSMRGRGTVVDRFSVDRNGDTLEGLLQSVVEGTGAVTQCPDVG